MYVNRVVYSQLINTGNYENERFEAEVMLEPDEAPEHAFITVKHLVQNQVAGRLKQLNAAVIDETDIPY